MYRKLHENKTVVIEMATPQFNNYMPIIMMTFEQITDSGVRRETAYMLSHEIAARLALWKLTDDPSWLNGQASPVLASQVAEIRSAVGG